MRPSADRPRGAHRAGCPDPQRSRLARPDLGWLVRRGAAPGSRSERLRLIAVSAVIALVVFAPVGSSATGSVFGNPLPGQAVANALSVTGFDIFAWNDPPTLARYLAVGPAGWSRCGSTDSSTTCSASCSCPGFPIALIGLLRAALAARGRASGRCVLSPADVPGHDPGLPGLDDLGHLPARGRPGPRPADRDLPAGASTPVRPGRAPAGLDQQVAWLGATARRSAAVLFSVALLPAYGGERARHGRAYQALARRDGRDRRPARRQAGPVIHDFPIWLAETQRIPRSPCPTRRRADVLDLAPTTSARRWLVISSGDHGTGRPSWPGRTQPPPASRRSAADPGDPAEPRRHDLRVPARVSSRSACAMSSGPLYSGDDGPARPRRGTGRAIRRAARRGDRRRLATRRTTCAAARPLSRGLRRRPRPAGRTSRDDLAAPRAPSDDDVDRDGPEDRRSSRRGRGRRAPAAGRSARDVDRRPRRDRTARDRAHPAGLGDPEPRADVAVPGARRRHADRRHRPRRTRPS